MCIREVLQSVLHQRLDKLPFGLKIVVFVHWQIKFMSGCIFYFLIVNKFDPKA